MRWRGWALVVVTIALAVTSVGWARAGAKDDAGRPSNARFSQCTFDGSTLVLFYDYGADQLVEPSVDMRGDRVVVRLRTAAGGGITPAIGLFGRARFTVFGADRSTPIEYADGVRLDCRRP